MHGHQTVWLAHFGKEGKPVTVTTRSRVSSVMNKLRKLGFIDSKGGSRRKSVLHVHSSLLPVVFHD
jgi:hypothetical protein